jgi:hypothetical protein
MIKLNDELEFKPHGPATEERIGNIEKLIGTTLPADYRNFLLSSGGGFIQDGIVMCKWPTPFGNANVTELSDVDGILRLLESDIIPRNMICIGAGHLGLITCVAVAGVDHGSVYALDTEMRYYWTAKDVSQRKTLAPSIQKFFADRDSGELLQRPWGYENCYLIAESFSMFASSLAPKVSAH